MMTPRAVLQFLLALPLEDKTNPRFWTLQGDPLLHAVIDQSSCPATVCLSKQIESVMDGESIDPALLEG